MNIFFKKGRLIVFFTGCSIILVLLICAYFKLAIKPAPQKIKNPPLVERGSIVDRSGAPLAVQTNFYRIGLNTKDVKDKNNFIRVMAPLFDLTESELEEKISRKREYVILKKKASQTEYEDIKETASENGFIFVNYEKLPGRIYPNFALASSLEV